MKYLIFSVLLLIVLYLISTAIYYAINKNRQISFDSQILSKDIFNVLKGLFIILIMWAHIGNLFGVRYLNPLGSWGVAIFLFCSGYGLQISYNKNKLTQFWKKRFLTAYVPYVLVEIVGYVFFYGKIGIKDIVFDLLFISPMHPFGWYMQCIFYMYIAFYIASLISKKDNIRCLIVFVFSLCLFIFARELFKQQLFTFTCGMLVAVHYKKISGCFLNLKALIITGVLGAAFLAAKQLSVVRNSFWVVLYLIEALQTLFLMLFAISFISIVSQKASKYLFIPLSFAGVMSYEIYLIHAFLMPKDISYSIIVMFFFTSIIIPAVIYFAKTFIKRQIQKI